MLKKAIATALMALLGVTGATAFLATYLQNDAGMDAYLNIVEYAKDGKWPAETSGAFKADHTFWKGFPERSAAGLRLEQRKP